MKTLLSCEFNMDTGCVELRYSDDSMISINCTAVEDEVAYSRFQGSVKKFVSLEENDSFLVRITI